MSSQYLAELGSASLADGASLTSDWIDMAAFDKYQVEALGDAVGLEVLYESSSEPDGAGASVSSPQTLAVTFFLGNFICRQRYMRFSITNNTGSPVTTVALCIKGFRGSSDKLSVSPLSGAPTDFSQAALVQAVSKGRQPDGDYVTTPADGAAFEETTPLAADGVFTSAWFDTDGWNSIDLFVAADVESADQGIEIEFTRDANAVTPVVDATWRRSFKATDVTQGFLEIRQPPILDGFRVRFTNGAAAQSSFLMVTTLKVLASNVKFNDAGAQLTGDFLTEVALGNVSNYEMGTKFGRNPDIDAGPEDIWAQGADYSGHTLTSPETVDVASTSTDDDSAGTGAQTIRLTGLESDTATEYTTEDITMDGTTPVTSSRSWWRINRIQVLTAGSGGQNAGDITVDPTTTGSSARFAAMPAGFNQTTIAAYTVPAGRTLLLKRVRASITRANGSAGSATITLRARTPGGVYRAIRIFELQTGAPTEFTNLGGDVLPAGTDIKYRVEQVSDPNTIAEAAMEFVLLDR